MENELDKQNNWTADTDKP